ncbi:glycine--tRNA ligase subunit beta [Polaromonas sp.]|uniref:glycine--tRNA ligase subunit beta n=1 Tax=Polaromonas sp. TaxID=1869339 RepID=UPI0017BC527C|nr:glycine--tRNA ligase subunit beta [Polaromonas sp.]NML84846.1 glycine--tRNA ligase subunit beta [Polaromonas sp.]
MTTQNLLVELFVEELPPKALKKLGEAFAGGVFGGLERRDFVDPMCAVTFYASPRRLAVHITNVRAISQPRAQAPKTLMPVSVGLDADGKPTAPLLKMLKTKLYHADVDVEWLMRERVFISEEGGKKVLKHDQGLAAGSTLLIGLESALGEAISNLPIPKVMTYQLDDGWSDVKFVRPAHGLVALHGSEVVKIQALGLTAGNTTHGHRFEALVDPVVLQDADSYAATLQKDGAVIASFADRRAEILKQLTAAAAKVGGGVNVIEDDALLDEVTGLVERPNVLVCEFEKEFLDVPQECLILTMKANQKYFPLLEASGKLSNKFLVVSNINPVDTRFVIGGNERVVRPRLADAKFFFDQDRKKTLASRVAGLGKVVYHNKLGSQGERVQRVRAIAKVIGQQLGGATLAAQADQAALLAKTDLVTDMVGEFPELQGVMGRYYALNDGLSLEVADAIEDHYKPRFAGDELPRNPVGLVVALADKLETLVGMFGIGNLPTGDKDPFALRRHALGVIRMLVEKDLPLNLDTLIQDAAATFKGIAGFEFGRAVVELQDFIYDRLAGSLRDQGYSAQEVDSVVSQKPQRLGDVARRLSAVRAFALLPEAPALAAANKRIGNILKKEPLEVDPHVSEVLLKEPAEIALYAAMKDVLPTANTQFDAGNYTASLQALAALRATVDAFFDGVMVNAEELDLRLNRQGLLKSLHDAMNRVADLSRLVS